MQTKRKPLAILTDVQPNNIISSAQDVSILPVTQPQKKAVRKPYLRDEKSKIIRPAKPNNN